MSRLIAIAVIGACSALLCAQAAPSGQYPSPSVSSPSPSTAAQASGPVPLDWTPPALEWLGQQAAVKNSFTFDKTMLQVAAGMLPDTDAPTRETIGKLDGLSVHVLRFANGIPDENAVAAIRQAYHLRGWKHIVTTGQIPAQIAGQTSGRSGGPLRNGTIDLWMVMDGVNMRGAVVLVETPKSLILATVAGNLSPVDLLHLRGHFGIPRFDGNDLQSLSAR